MIVNKRNIVVNPNKTIYADLDLPETDEEIVEQIKMVKRKISNDSFDAERKEVVAPFKDTFVKYIEDGLDAYKKTGNMQDLLNKYALVDLGIRRALLKKLEAKGEMSNREVNDIMQNYHNAWSILIHPEARAEYDRELKELRRIEAIKNRTIRERVMRNKIARDELAKEPVSQAFDRSFLRGDKIRERAHEVPQYAWRINMYPRGKKLIFKTDTHYHLNSDLNENIEVYALGTFEYGAGLRQDSYGMLNPTYSNELCEVISIKKTDSRGNVTTSYGIAQTRDLGQFMELTEKEIEEKEMAGIQVLLLRDHDEPAISNTRKELYSRRKQTPVRRESLDGISKVNRILDKIGLEIPTKKKAELPPRVNIETASKVISKSAPTILRDPNKKYKVFVLEPIRYKLSEEDASKFAKLYLSDYMISLADECNGFFLGSIDELKVPMSQALKDETITACQYATTHKGYLYGAAGVNSKFEMNSLVSALRYIEERSKANSIKIDGTRLRTTRNIRDTYGE